MSARVLVLDPLSLVGREFLTDRERLSRMVSDFGFFHTDLDEEHQIAEVADDPALVPPLESAEQLKGFDVIVVASDAISSRHDHLLEHLAEEADVALIDLSHLGCLDDLVEPSAGRVHSDSRRLRVTHPALTATSSIVELLQHLGKLRGSLIAVDPVSSLGREGIDLLAQQALLRVQGAPVADRIFGHVLAFNTVAVDSGDLQTEAAIVLPDTPLAVVRCLGGCFHGHLAFLTLSFDRSLELTEIESFLGEAEDLELATFPIGLDSVPDNDRILVAPPALSPDGSQLALTLMADGLRAGGAMTAIDILDSLV